MLSTLRIKNLAIVDELAIDLQPGLNVLTGETGAGKSIILKAISLLGGGRAGSELIRRGSERCEIEALFLLTPIAKSTLLLDRPDLSESLEDDELLIRRVIESGGRSRFTMNGRLATRGEIEQLSVHLLDFTGQHEQHRLLDASRQRDLLDAFGVSETLLDQVRSAYHEYARARDLLEEVRKSAGAREDYLRRIQFENEELSQAALQEGEREDLEQQLERLSHAELLSSVVSESSRLLEGEGGDPGVLAGVNRALSLLESGIRHDERLREIYALFESARIQLTEAQLAAGQYLNRLELDPEQIEHVRERLAEVARLERKYQRKLPELIEYATQIAGEIERFQEGAFDEEKLAEELAQREAALRKLGSKLTKEREKSAKELSGLVQKELEQLNMKAARFEVQIENAPSGPSGADAVVFQLSANPGEPPRPLAKVASGGELSRVLLVLKTALNERTAPLLQVFDEVDTGIGGAVAQVVGERLRRLAQSGQVLLVTHAPQIAALATSHFVIAKSVERDRTSVSVTAVQGEQRIGEVARMLAGKKVTENFEDSARELLGIEKRRSSRTRHA